MKKNLLKALALFSCVALLLAGCGGSAKKAAESYNDGGRDMYSYEEIPEMAGTAANSVQRTNGKYADYNDGAETEQTAAQSDRKLVKTLAYSIESKEFDQCVQDLKALAIACGGYIEESSIGGKSYYDGGTRNASFIFRIPVASLDQFQEGAGAIGNILSSTENVQDITLTYTDTASRVKALEAQRDSLIAMLEKAETLEDLLTVQDHLTDVEYQLEYYASQLRLFDNQVEYSKVSVSLREVKDYTEPDPESFGDRLSRTFRDSIKGVGVFLEDAAIFLLGNLPGILVFAAVVTGICLLFKKIFRRKKARKLAKKEKEMISEE